MKISLSQNQFFDDQGFPLVSGRVTIYLHNSDTPADIFVLSGDEYEQAPNPIICYEDGRIPTVFFEATIVDVKLEKANGDGTYDLIDTYQDGFEATEGTHDTLVSTVTELKNVAPEVGTVTVCGYDLNIKAPPRTYVWDPTCTVNPDDGVVIMSETTETGRWILLWDDEKLPCTVYGITPGHESNIAAFLAFPDFIGQWSIRTPRICRFLSGTYTSATTYSTTKELYFDSGVSFTSATFYCKSIKSEPQTSYIADFYFSANNVTAHSSWFRSVDAFWHCGADVFHVDESNWFTSSQLNSVVTLTNKVIEGAHLFPMTYSGSYFQLTGTTVPDGFFVPNRDYVSVGENYGDEMFQMVGTWDPGLISAGHHIQYQNVPELTRFKSTARWLSTMIERKNRISSTTDILDLQGRSVYNITSCPFGTIMNVHVTGDLGVSSASTTLKNVICDGWFTQNCSFLYVYNSSLKYGSDPQNGSSITCWNSLIESYSSWGPKASIELHNCRWRVGLNYATDNTSSVPQIVAYDSEFDASGTTHNIKRGYFYGCKFVDQHLNIYPFTESSYRTIKGALVGCEWRSSTPIKYTFYRTVNGADDTNCKNVRFNYRWENNTFNGNDKGITAPFWSFAASNSRFIDSSNQTITYEGNVGKCPAGQFRGSYEDNSAWVSKRNYAIGSDWYVRVRTGSSVWRMFPKFPNQTNGNAGSSIQYCKNVEGKTFMYGFCSAFDLKDTDDPYDFFDFWATGASDQHSTTFINIV